MTEAVSDQIGGHARLRAELLKSARVLERLGGVLQGIVIVLCAVGLIAALFLGSEKRCAGGSIDPGGTSTCLAGTSHPYVAQALGLAATVLLLGVVLVALLQLMVVVGKYCSYRAYGTRADWIRDSP